MLNPVNFYYSTAGYPNRRISSLPAAYSAQPETSAYWQQSNQQNNLSPIVNNGCSPNGTQQGNSDEDCHHQDGADEMMHACRHYVLDRFEAVQDALPGLRDTLLQGGRVLLRGAHDNTLVKRQGKKGHEYPFPVGNDPAKGIMSDVVHDASRFVIER
jgi:hypothetical protein